MSGGVSAREPTPRGEQVSLSEVIDGPSRSLCKGEEPLREHDRPPHQQRVQPSLLSVHAGCQRVAREPAGHSVGSGVAAVSQMPLTKDQFMTIHESRHVIEHQVSTAKGRVHVNEYPGDGPAIVMTHGFPDDSRIYDRLLPELAARHVITFDFLGHGHSDRDATWPLESGQREGEVAAIMDALELEKPILVGHDIGGPVAIRYTLADPTRVGGLVLLNTFFGDSPTLEFPEFIRMLADRHLAPLVDEIIADPTTLTWMLLFTNSKLNPGPPDLNGVGGLAILPQFFGDRSQPDSVAAIRAWTADLFPGIREQNAQIESGELSRLELPVTIAFGENDPYMNAGVAEHLHSLFPASVMRSISGAAHWPQWDQPVTTAAAIVEI